MANLNRDDFIRWANTNEARGLLPMLVHRLIASSDASIEQLVMPFGDSIGRSGLDGFVTTTKGTSKVPSGVSVWEMGVNSGVRTKANQDFAKRTKSTSKYRQADTTYVVVTPRHWENKASWIEDRSKESEWKEIKAYDVDDLLGWLQDAPAVAAWFARMLGKPSSGVRDVNGYWENATRGIKVSVSPSVLLGGRESIVDLLADSTSDGPGRAPIAICCRSPAEVVPFAVASICMSEDQSLLGRTIVLSSRQIWKAIIVEETDLILVVDHSVQPTIEELQQAVSSRHKVIYCGNSSTENLKRLDTFEAEKCLVASGVDEAKAAQIVTRCGGDGRILLDQLSGLIESVGTPMSRLPDRIKSVCLLVGGWDGQRSSDQQAIEYLTGLRYADIEQMFQEDSRDPHGMLFAADGKYRLLAPEREWNRFSRLVPREMVYEFRGLVQWILTDDDPTVGLSDTDRWIAQFEGKAPEFSSTLRHHVIETLALAASNAVPSSAMPLDESFCESVVREVLMEGSFERWASLRSRLCLLCEAAPVAVLDAIERELAPAGSMSKLFSSQKRDMFTTSPHAGVLWALERMGWSSRLLPRVAKILVSLHRICGELQVSNTPANSFKETLQISLPQTNSTVEQRQTVIVYLLERHRNNSWHLVASLQPKSMGSFVVRSKPAWRDWAYGWKAERSPLRIRDETAWTIDQLIATAESDATRWIALLSFWENTSVKQYHRILDECLSVKAKGIWSDDELKELWESLNRTIVWLNFVAGPRMQQEDNSSTEAKQKEDAPGNTISSRYANLHGEFHDRLVELRDELIPKDKVLASVHAFCVGVGEKHLTHHFNDRLDHEKRTQTIAKVQKRYIDEIFSDHGFEGVVRLAEHSESNAEIVGRVLSQSESCKNVDVGQLIYYLGEESSDTALLAKGFIAGLQSNQGQDSFKPFQEFLEKCQTPQQKAGLLLSLRVDPTTWDCVDSQSEQVVEQYWQQTRLPFDTPEDQMPRLVRRLIAYERSDDAVHQLGHFVHRDGKCNPELILDTLEGLLAQRDDKKRASSPRNLRWELQGLFSRLYDGESPSQEELNRLVRIEFAFSKLFDHDEDRGLQPHGFIRLLSESPSAFIEAVAFLSRDDNGAFRHETEEDATVQFKRQVSSLIRSLTMLPGLAVGRKINKVGCELTDWVSQVVDIASKEKYVKATCRHLAEILTRGSFVSSATWPTEHVARAINLIDSEETREHLRLGLYNDRGVHCVDHSGQANRDAATQRRNQADKIEAICPAAAHALREYAATLDNEANRLIEQARWGHE